MKKVAFICVHNSCRSQIAEALGKHFASDVFESYSAGSEIKNQINPDAVRLMKKVYSFWIIPQATKSKDGCINQLKIAENHLSGNYEEKRESYDKEEQLMIYLSKGHSPNDKYESYDEILMPIGALLNNTLNYQEKNEVIKEYGLEDEEFEERMRDMCNLGEALELEAIESERVRNIRNIIDEFHCSLEKAMDILKLTEKERQEIMPYFQA